MIVKHFNLNENSIVKNNLFLFYGDNEGLKNEIIKKILKNSNYYTYDEKEILDNVNIFFENISSKSLFDENKIILIKRCTDKILKIVNNLSTQNISDLVIIFNSRNLEKKSKLRTLFEKEKDYICSPFYMDNEQTLTKLSYDYLKNVNISISPANINLLINKCNGDRQTLLNELNKIECLGMYGKKINSENLGKIINLAENYHATELVDQCLAKNKKKTINILNENNFSPEDSVMIIRILLNKAKKILQLSNQFKVNKNINLTIDNARPPIFWKDKDITKQQVFNWEPKTLKKMIYKLNEIEFLIKKNINNSVSIVTNFLLEQCSSKD
mgnify:CR=1 FL=1